MTIQKSAYKSFDKDIHDLCDPPSREAVKSWVKKKWNITAEDYEKYKVDLICSQNNIYCGYIEIEVRQWFTGLPIRYPTIHIPVRKKKLFENDLRTIYFVVSGDFKHGMWTNVKNIMSSNVVEVKNTAIESGEYFYDVPTSCFNYVNFLEA